jgi:hypothetical protein
VDASGHTATATVTNLPGTVTPALVTVAPSAVTLSSCTGSASVTIAGGASNIYFVSSGSDAITTLISGNNLTIKRNNNSGVPGAGPFTVGVTDGLSTASVTVNLVGDALGACSTLIQAVPSVVTLSDCTTAQTVTLSGGGSGNYVAASENAAVKVTQSGPQNSILSISRVNPSTGGFTPPGIIDITIGTNSTQLLVNATGTGAGSGTGTCP